MRGNPLARVVGAERARDGAERRAPDSSPRQGWRGEIKRARGFSRALAALPTGNQSGSGARRMMFRNSARVRGSERKSPSRWLVIIATPGL